MAQDSIRVVARIVSKADKVTEVQSILRNLIGPIRKDPGCLECELLQNESDKTDFTFVETWQDVASPNAHLNSPHIKEAIVKTQGLLTVAPDIRQYHLLA